MYLVASSLDGFIATEDHDLDWLLQFDPHEPTNPYAEFIENVGAIAMGARTYDWLLARDEGGWPYGALPCWVFTHHDRPRKDGANLHFTEADVREVHAEMLAAAGDRDVWLVGGGELVGQFLDHELVDALWVSITPVLLGSGAPLLPRRRCRPMHVVDVRHGPGRPFVHVLYSLR